ncbi:MAG: hypothetical protein U9N32_06555 [Spirochaetota bacterium]|nr:hypothetical protein [Spirochaetota bacterium]
MANPFKTCFSASYRFGEDPDAPTAIIRSLKFSESDIPDLFAAMQSYYVDNPLGSISITNSEKHDYEVYRSLQHDSGFIKIRSNYAGTSYIDPNVSDNTWYYYRVSPAFSDVIKSVHNGAQTHPFPPEPYKLKTIDTTGNAYGVAVSGSYAYVADYSSELQIIDLLPEE